MKKKQKRWLATHETWGDKSWHIADNRAEAMESAMEYYHRNPAQGKPIKLVRDYDAERKEKWSALR